MGVFLPLSDQLKTENNDEKAFVRCVTIQGLVYLRREDVASMLEHFADGETNEIREWAKSVARTIQNKGKEEPSHDLT
jgi:hypothetical protein